MSAAEFIQQTLELIVMLSIVAGYVAVFALALFVLVLVGFICWWAYHKLRARRRHARYVPKGFRRDGRVPLVNRPDLVPRI